MKIKGEFIMRELVGEILLVPVGQTALQFNGMITLNPVSAQIWRSLEQGAPYEEILRGILDQFDVAEDTARQDLDRFLEEMRGRDLLRNDTPAPRNRIVHNLYKFDGPYSAEFGATCACCQMEFPV